nr:MAG TPA: hypothetical protein [Caudoviricetes sp.]
MRDPTTFAKSNPPHTPCNSRPSPRIEYTGL